MTEYIRERLCALAEPTFARFQRSLLPTLPAERVLGVRTPALRALARELYRDPMHASFLEDVPHAYFEEDQLHAFLIEPIADIDLAWARVAAFLPYIDNWATCDQLSPRAFFKRPTFLLPHISRIIRREHPYSVRFAIELLMRHFLDASFDPVHLQTVASVTHEAYYVRMMVAWYFATALAKQYDHARIYLEEGRLDRWTHNKTIQKAVESRRISPSQKQYLRTLKRNL